MYIYLIMYVYLNYILFILFITLIVFKFVNINVIYSRKFFKFVYNIEILLIFLSLIDKYTF